MTWQRIARKDFEDAVRSRMFWAIIAISLLLMTVITFSIATENLDDQGQELVYIIFSTLGSQFIIPITGLVFGYLAIAGERESGSLRILFGLSHNRTAIVFGKLASRSSLIVVGVLVAIGIVAGLVVFFFDSFDTTLFLWFGGLTILLALTFTGVAVGISAMTGTRPRAMAGALGSYVLFFFLWNPLLAMIHYAIKGVRPGYAPPDWYLFGLMLNPLEAYREALGQLTDQYIPHLFDWDIIVEDIDFVNIPAGGTLRLEDRAGGADAPIYLSDWFAIVVFLFWFILPVMIGYLWFLRADLN